MMNYDLTGMAHQLQVARKNLGLSQRELSTLTGIPQAQISRIEAGSVDLRVSSLSALARALGLELALIPRKAVPAMRSLSRETLKPHHPDIMAGRKEMRHINRIMQHLQLTTPELEGLLLLQKTLFRLQQFRGTLLDTGMLKKLRQALKRIDCAADGTSRDEALDKSLTLANMIHIRAMQAPQSDREDTSSPPAYSLDEENDDA